MRLAFSSLVLLVACVGGSSPSLLNAQIVAESTATISGRSGQPAATVPSRDYRGPQVHIPGIFVTPVPNAPFTATVQIVSHELLPDGSEHIVTTINHIARQSSGRIYNERRLLVPAGFKGEPRLLEAHLYDPSSRLNTFIDPARRLVRETTLDHPPATTPGPTEPGPALPDRVDTGLGEQNFQGIALRGMRRTRTVPADRSGTGKEVVITDDYWYSPALSIYLTIRHDDPRSGEQLVSVTEIHQGEPDANLFALPPEYKVVDETPLPQTGRATAP